MALVEALRQIGVPVVEITVLGLNCEVVPVDELGLTVNDAGRIDCFPPTSEG